MFNFREEFEQIKRAKSDYPQFAAEMIMEKILSRLRIFDFKDMETLDFTYHPINDKYYLSTAKNTDGIFFAKEFDSNAEGKEIFEKMKVIVRENYSDVVIEEDSFYLKF